MPGGAPGAVRAAGAITLGVEEEFVLLDPSTGATVLSGPDLVRMLDGEPGVQQELMRFQVETGTRVCTALDDVGGELIRLRLLAAAAAARLGCRLVASGVAPYRTPGLAAVTGQPRYQELARRYGRVVADAGTCACHVHVGVPSRDLGVQVLARLRPWLAPLLAVSANSPIAGGRDTGWASWRYPIWSRWPTAVPPAAWPDAAAYDEAKLDANQQTAARNTRHEYLLRALISCGACRLTCGVRQTPAGYRYYQCRGRTDPLRVAQGKRCTARYIPAGQLDELVWADLCALVTDPAQVARALARAQGGAWLPQELHARQTAIRQALGQLDRQQQRLLDAYLAEIIGLAEFQRKRDELDRRRAALAAQQRQLDAAAAQRLELQAVADGIEAFCQAIHAGLATATFEQRRQLAELLIDRVIVTDGQVEIRCVLPTSPDGPHRPFCQLRKDHLASLPVLAGVPSGPAFVATLAYRLVSYWLPVLIGGPAHLMFRHRYGAAWRRSSAHQPTSSYIPDVRSRQGCATL